MMQENIIHRDLKLDNIMVHFPERTNEIVNMNKQ